tara:strand:- start:2168 stop:3379 length:1212 start_codon:yes stop_codon:yes gene_type:complete
MTTYSNINGLALIGTGEESGTWGTVTNLNMQAVDRATHGYKEITLGAGSTFDLITNNMTQSSDLDQNGNYKAIRFSGTPGTDFSIVIKSNEVGQNYDQEKVYMIHNNTANTMTVTQNTGGNVTISSLKSKIIAAKGPGIVDVLAGLESSAVLFSSGSFTGDVTSGSANITGGTITGITDLAVADGGTGAGTAALARQNLGLEIGTNVQAFNSTLTEISGLAKTLNYFIVANGTAWTSKSPADTILSLGVNATAAQLDYNAITTLGTSENEKVVTQSATGTVNLTGVIKAASYQETYLSVSHGATNSTQLDCAASNNFSTTLTQNTSITFDNIPALDTAYSMVLEIQQDSVPSNYTVTFPASINWAEGTAPILSTAANAIDIISLYTRDGGINWYAFVSGLRMS